MFSPTTDTAINRSMDLGAALEDFDVDANNQGLVGLAIAPALEVGVQSASFGKLKAEELMKDVNTERASGSTYNRTNRKFTTDSYATKENGLEEPIDQREARIYRDYLDAELVAAKALRANIARGHEARVVSLVTNASAVTSVGVSAGTWSTLASAKPIDDVETGIQAIRAACGLIANVVVMSWKAFRNCRNCAQIIDRIKQGGFGTDNPKQINRAILAQIFDVDEVVIAGSQTNTANEGQAAVFGSIWTDSIVGIYRRATTQDIKEPCIARTMHWGEDGSQIGGLLESYYSTDRRSNIIRCRMETDEKMILAKAGYCITGVLA